MDPSTEKMLFKIWSLDRHEKKVLLSEPTLTQVIEAAHLKGLVGVKLVVEEDGSEIDEDELLKYFSGKPLILLKEGENWNPITLVSTTPVLDNQEIIYLQNNVKNYSNEQQPVLLNIQPDSYQLKNNETESETCSTYSTMSMTSGALSFEDSENENFFIASSIKDNFDKFVIPWQKFPKSIIDQCENNQKLGTNLKTIVHIIVDELRTTSYYIPVGVFRDVTSKLVTRYPKTFMYTDMEGNQITIKNSPLITSFIQRNNYLNRPHHSKAFQPSIPLKKKRISKNFEETCVNWQGNQEIEEQDVISYKLKLLEFNLKKTWNKDEFDEILKLMDLCYTAQRSFLNNFINTPSLKNIKENWPFLLHKVFIYKHFTKLTKTDIDKICGNFEMKIKKIITFGHQHQPKIMMEVMKKSNSEEMSMALNFISKYFNEDVNFVFQTFPIGTVKPDIVPPGLHPWFCSVETEAGTVFYIHADNELVSSSTNNFQEVFIQTFGLYYVLNVQYPKDASQSYEFMQRYFFELYTEGSRGRKKNLTAMAKVMRFLNKVQEIKI